MDNQRAGLPLSDLSALFRVGVVAGMSDEQLLETLAAAPEAECQIAFEAIVRRHGPMVLGVCRRLLRSHQDRKSVV